jgi:undecaprenyl-phosphate galactose phosphotransferase
VGKKGKIFKCFKFRTMYLDAEDRLERILSEDLIAREEWEKFRKIKNDPRITRVGKFLRKTSLDELPQLINVFKGEMSLIGPRPVVQEEIDKYYKDAAKLYFSVLPGITGLWQVSGRSDTNYEYRVALDAWYVRNWHPWIDIVILLKTIKVVISGKGAY